MIVAIQTAVKDDAVAARAARRLRCCSRHFQACYCFPGSDSRAEESGHYWTPYCRVATRVTEHFLLFTALPIEVSSEVRIGHGRIPLRRSNRVLAGPTYGAKDR